MNPTFCGDQRFTTRVMRRLTSGPSIRIRSEVKYDLVVSCMITLVEIVDSFGGVRESDQRMFFLLCQPLMEKITRTI